MNIDLSRFKVIYANKVMNAISLQEVIYSDGDYPRPDVDHLIFKPKFLTVLVINEDGNVITICDEAWRFQLLQKENDMNIHDATEIAYKNGYQAALDSITHCKECTHSDTLQCSVGYVWCDRMCRYMKEDGFCSFGERKDNG